MFEAARQWAAALGAARVSFRLDETAEPEALAAFGRAFGDVTPTPISPDGRAAEIDDPSAYVPENWEGGSGLLVKFLAPGQGVLAGIDSTDALTRAFARHRWTFFQTDVM